MLHFVEQHSTSLMGLPWCHNFKQAMPPFCKAFEWWNTWKGSSFFFRLQPALTVQGMLTTQAWLILLPWLWKLIEWWTHDPNWVNEIQSRDILEWRVVIGKTNSLPTGFGHYRIHHEGQNLFVNNFSAEENKVRKWRWIEKNPDDIILSFGDSADAGNCCSTCTKAPTRPLLHVFCYSSCRTA